MNCRFWTFVTMEKIPIHHHFSQTIPFLPALLAESTISTHLSSAEFLFLPCLAYFIPYPVDHSFLVPGHCFHFFFASLLPRCFPGALFLFLLDFCVISLLLFKSNLSRDSETLFHFILPLQMYHSLSCILPHTRIIVLY